MAKSLSTFNSQEQSSRAPLQVAAEALEQLLPPHNRVPAAANRLTELEFDGFHVALVPFHPLKPGATLQGDLNHAASRLLILPMTWKQLMTRVRHEIAPPNQMKRADLVRFGQVTLNPDTMEVFRTGRRVPLTAKEFRVLTFFISNPDRVIPRDEMLDKVWGYENYPCTRTVDNHILRLRQKLEMDPANPVHFLTVHGVGYRFIP